MQYLRSWRRRRSLAVLLGAFAISIPVSGCPNDPPVVQVTISADDAEQRATAVLIRREPVDSGESLTFLTIGRLLRGGRPWSKESEESESRVTIGGGETLIGPAAVVVPMGTGVDVAVVRVVTPRSALVPASLSTSAPRAGEAFRIVGLRPGGAVVTVPQQARFVSTRYVVGDRDLSALAGCLGAPALGDAGVFGVVTNCGAGRTPTITLLSAAESFLTRTVAGLVLR